MKKAMIVLLVLLLTVACIFFWKGGHHALSAANELKDILNAAEADQSLTLRTRESEPSGNGQFTLYADIFWTDFAGDRVYGLTAENTTVYLRNNILCTETGRAYALPDFSGQLRELTTGVILYGKVTKTADTYKFTMDTPALSLTAELNAQTLRLDVHLPDGATYEAVITSKEPASHDIPRSVTDAWIQAEGNPPMSILEPLEILFPVMEDLFPVAGDLNLRISCGILNLTETVHLTVDAKTATVTKGPIVMDLKLPAALSELNPAAGVMLLLGSGEFIHEGESVRISMILPPQTTVDLLEALVPQAADLGICLERSTLSLEIRNKNLTAASISAAGTVPFLITTIPVEFSADLTVK